MALGRVRSLLGKPDEIADDGTWVYNIGREDEFLLDTCVSLEIWTNHNRVERAAVMRDS